MNRREFLKRTASLAITPGILGAFKHAKTFKYFNGIETIKGDPKKILAGFRVMAEEFAFQTQAATPGPACYEEPIEWFRMIFDIKTRDVLIENSPHYWTGENCGPPRWTEGVTDKDVGELVERFFGEYEKELMVLAQEAKGKIETDLKACTIQATPKHRIQRLAKKSVAANDLRVFTNAVRNLFNG